MNRINIYRTAKGWMAAYAGPYAQEVKAAFGCATLPTAFTARAEYENVLPVLKELNPGFEINLVPEVVYEAIFKAWPDQATEVVEQLGYDSLNGNWHFNRWGMYVGVEDDGYIHT
jgi:hypothetical protein